MLCSSYQHEQEGHLPTVMYITTSGTILLLPLLRQPHIFWLLRTKLDKLNHWSWVTLILPGAFFPPLPIIYTNGFDFTVNLMQIMATRNRIWDDSVIAWIALLFWKAAANVSRSSLKSHFHLSTGQALKAIHQTKLLAKVVLQMCTERFTSSQWLRH